MRDFMVALWRPDANPDALAELRSIRGGIVQQNFYGLDELPELEELARTMDADGFDCYVGVLPRMTVGGTAADCVQETHVLWADVDAKAHDGSKAAALFALGQANLTPSILVDSGGGWHGYWLLREAHPFSVVQPLMRGLQRAIGSDAVHDAPRILRLPGTRNHKECWADEWQRTVRSGHPDGLYCKPVRLLHFDPQRQYRLSDFDDYAPEDAAPRHYAAVGERVDWLDLPTWLTDLIEQGAPVGQRSEAIFRAVMWLHRYGWDEARIRHVLDREPIGQKLQEMRPEAGDRWYRRTFDKAVTEAA